MIKINDYFISSYLTAGSTKDNFVFEDCSLEFLSKAITYLIKQSNDVKSCTITIDENIEHSLSLTLEKFQNNIHKKIIARDYICSRILHKLLILSGGEEDVIKELESGINAIETGDKQKIEQFHLVAPMPFDITSFYREKQKFELNFILKDTNNTYLQEAINNFISSREPYSIKIFSTKSLPTYHDQTNNLIENPHDYMKRNVQNFIEVLNEKQ